MYIGDWHPPVDGGDDPSGSGPSSGGDPYIGSPPEPQDQGSKPNTLPYDPSDPRDFDPTGSGSSVPTQNAIGKIGGFLGNLAFPGLGFLTGPAAKAITAMIQNGASRAAVQRAVAAYQSNNGGGDTGSGTPGDGGSPGGFKMPNFGNMFGGLPPGFTEGNRFGGGAPTFEGPGFTGPSWSPGGSIFGGRMNPNMNLAGAWTNIGAGSGGNFGGNFSQMYGNEILRHAMKFGMMPQNAFGGPAGTWTPQLIQQYQTSGLPNPGAFGQPTSPGNKPGGELPMKQTV